MTFRIVISKKAKSDYRRMRIYIRKRSLEGAKSWSKAFYTAIGTIQADPFRYKYALEADILEEDIRQKLFSTPGGKPYRIVFRVEESTVRVLRIRGHGQSELNVSDLPNG